MSAKKDKGMCQIQNVRFYNLTPRSINFISYNANACKLALSRTDASIEIWDIRHAVYMEKCILGQPSASVEAVAWLNERLFSTGHTGELTEWNLKTLEPKQKVLLTGNAAWCLDTHDKSENIAVGTEEGYLNLFNGDNNELNYVKIFDKQEGRILCSKFDHSGDILVTGSIDTIRVWDVKSGHAIYRMATGRAEAKTETIVWSVAVLKDLTIIAGDSRGRITVWDGRMGAQLDTFAALKADVLSVAVNEEENMFCCSGIDPLIKMFALTPVKKDNIITNKWIKFLQRNLHDHDTKTLAFSGNLIFSGGIDGYLGISNSTKSTQQRLTKYGPFLSQPCATVTEKSRLLLLKYFNYLEVWRLGIPSKTVELCEDEMEKCQYLSLEKGLRKLIELRSKSDEPIVCTSLSPTENLLIYSTDSTIRAFKLNDEISEFAKIFKILDLPNEFSACTHITFSADGTLLYLAKKTGIIDVFTVSGDGIDFIESIEISKVIKDTLKFMVLSKCGKYLVLVGTCCTIAVFHPTKDSGSWQHYLTLPKYDLTPTAIAMHQNAPLLVAAFPDSKIFEYHIEEMRFTCSSQKQFVPNGSTHAVHNIVLDPRNKNIVILHNDTNLFVLEKIKPTTMSEGKLSKKESKINTDSVHDFKRIFKKNYEHFVHLSWLGKSEMVAVGVNPVTLIEQLPPSLRKKKFGVS